jgi:hypothetical protein
VDLTDGSATTVGTLTADTAGEYGGGTFHWGAFTTDGTDQGVSHGQTTVSYKNEAGTVTCNASTSFGVTEIIEGSLSDFPCSGACNVSGTSVQLQINCTVTGITETELSGSGAWVFTYGTEEPGVTWSNDFTGGG